MICNDFEYIEGISRSNGVYFNDLNESERIEMIILEIEQSVLNNMKKHGIACAKGRVNDMLDLKCMSIIHRNDYKIDVEIPISMGIFNLQSNFNQEIIANSLLNDIINK